ncbi:MAG: hypothetical protein M3405_06385 [Acidobacteriota bacterium]|jgi:hypothetical protein|nr:hypothetical protein [Acidobacteriota bacterium]
MVKPTSKYITDEKIKSNENRISNILDYTSQTPSNLIKFNDDLIISLADAYENKRARRVFEWESIRRKHFQQTI